MEEDILKRITEDSRKILAEELGVEERVLLGSPPKGFRKEWEKASEDRAEARLMADLVIQKFS